MHPDVFDILPDVRRSVQSAVDTPNLLVRGEAFVLHRFRIDV